MDYTKQDLKWLAKQLEYVRVHHPLAWVQLTNPGGKPGKAARILCWSPARVEKRKQTNKDLIDKDLFSALASYCAYMRRTNVN